MQNFANQLTLFESLIPFVEALRSMTEAQWIRPLQPGKWSTNGVIGHLMLWDRHFMEKAIRPIASGTPLTLKKTDYNLFNRQAAAYAATIPRDQLIDACIAERRQLVGLLNSMTPEQLETTYVDSDGNPFTVEEYLVDFMGHDRHHRLQIEQFLSA